MNAIMLEKPRTCPAWCSVCPSMSHTDHYGTVADWEGPGALVVEVGISRRDDGSKPPQVLVETERYDEEGRTTMRRIVSLTPAQASATGAFLAGYDDRLSGALVRSVRLLGPASTRAD